MGAETETLVVLFDDGGYKTLSSELLAEKGLLEAAEG